MDLPEYKIPVTPSNRLLHWLGLLVIVIGIGGLLDKVLPIGLQSYFMPTHPHEISFITTLILVFMGFAILTILDSEPYDQQPQWLWIVRYGSLAMTWIVVLGFGLQQLISSRFNLPLVLVHDEQFIVPFLSLVNGFLFCLAFTLVLFYRHRPNVVAYGVCITTLVAIQITLFALVDIFSAYPALFDFNMSLWSITGYLIIGFAILIGTIPFEGLFEPILSPSNRIKLLALFTFVLGALVLLIGVLEVAKIQINLDKVGVYNLQNEFRQLFLGFELGTIILSTLLMTMSLRSLHYWGTAHYYAQQARKSLLTEASIRHLIQAAHSTLNLEDVFQEVVNEVGQQLHVDRCFIAQFENQTYHLHPPVREYRANHAIPSMIGIKPPIATDTNPLLKEICMHLQPTEVDPDTPNLLNSTRAAMRELKIKSGLAMAISYQGRCYAMLFLHQIHRTRTWSNAEKDLLQILASQAAVAIHQAYLYQELRLSEKKTDLFINSINDYAILMLDPEGLVLNWNSGAEHVSGYKTEEALGQSITMFFTEPDILRGTPQHILDIALKEGRYEGEGWRRRKDGTKYWSRASVTPIYSETGQLSGYASVTHDTTERKQWEQQLILARRDAERANQQKSQFLANMSHELRTPLNAIIGYSQMMERGMGGRPLNEKEQRYTHNILTSGRHLLGVVNDLLDISKAEADKIILQPNHIALEPLFKELDSMMSEIAKQRNVKLYFEIEPGLNGIEADPQRLSQIFINLISNAIKFNKPNGEVRVRVSKSQDKQWIISEITDTGIGIAQDKIANLFKVFYQVDSDVSRKYEGTGLGLALTKRLVELHGGSINVESHEGKGTTFRFMLPVNIEAQKKSYSLVG